MQPAITLFLLILIKTGSRLLFRFREGWVGGRPENPWRDVRLVAILNHTSLYEPIYAGLVPFHFLVRIARHGLVPVAAKTMRRPLVGRFFRLIAPNVVPITRRRDHTWSEFGESIGSDSLVVILPEGRMKRATGLDSKGRPMTVRGGIADVLLAIPEGKLIVAYSGGLHHVQVPGQRLPRLFQTVWMNFEELRIEEYREGILETHDHRHFKQGVIEDLEARRDRYCPTPDNPEARKLARTEEDEHERTIDVEQEAG
ncbi:MAG: 1-acyl-sn-glycerol-3-phosphate acyltransferase [Thermoanaerobaculia bacterium]|nr:1-acyl-sn-glycerol-3-phosphate acyltransferase [Thermoanaerobaculia bacterium]